MMPDTLQKLQEVIASNSYDIKTGPDLFINKKGPSQPGSGSNEIYLDCQPVGTSEETTDTVTSTGTTTSLNINDILNSPIVLGIFSAIIFIIILVIIHACVNFG
jgi:hypothetical protein